MPDWRSYVQERLPRLGLRPEREAEVVEELAQQLEQAYADARAQGQDDDEAIAAANAQISDWTKLAQEIRLAEEPVAGRLPEPLRGSLHERPALGRRTANMWADLWQDARYGVRTLRKSLGFTLVAVLTLALGIGANAAIFSVVNAVLLRPLPYPEAEQLVYIVESNLEKGWASFDVSPPNFVDWRKQSESFTEMFAVDTEPYSYTGGELPEQLPGLRVTEGFFDVLRVHPALGRGFLATEFQPGRERVVLLSYSLWQRLFAGRPNVLGQTMPLNGEVYTIVGVMPPDFRFGGRSTGLWAPLVFNAGELSRRGAHFLVVFGRLRGGRTLEQAQAEMDQIAERLRSEYPNTNRGWGVSIRRVHDAAVAGVRKALLVLLGAAGLVLLIACVNVANMQLTRATTRVREVAIRTAMGASRLRLLQQLLVESVLLAVVGGGMGLLLAYWGVDAVLALSPDLLPRQSEIAVDAPVLVFALLLSLAVGAVFGLAPAWLASRTNSWAALKEGSPTGAVAGRRRLRSLMVVTEISLALMLLVGSGLFVRSFSRLTSVPPGFRTDHALTMSVTLPRTKYPEPKQMAAFFERLHERLATLPGVDSVAMTSLLPLGGDDDEIYSFQVEGQPEDPNRESPSALYYVVTPGYLHTMGIPLLSGRDFTAQDTDQSTRVCIINDVMARQLFTGRDPVGQRIRLGRNTDSVREIVGVAASVKHYGLMDRPTFQLYELLPQRPRREMTILLRTSVEPTSLAGTMGRALRDVDPEQPAVFVRTLEELQWNSMALPRFRTLLLGLFAGLALVLASVGLYGVMAYSVAQRTREIGLRMALGAQPGDVLRMVVREGMVLVVLGVAIGLAGALGSSRVLASLLFEISPWDAATLSAVTAGLALVALLACYLPARRAAQMDPMGALRYE